MSAFLEDQARSNLPERFLHAAFNQWRMQAWREQMRN
jgi:hypothetical protein